MNRGDPAAVLKVLRETDADVVCVQEVMEHDVLPMAKELQYPHHCYFRDFEWLDADSTPRARGIATFSRFPLHDAQPTPNRVGGVRGIWAEVHADDARFMLASVHLSATFRADLDHIKASSNARLEEIGALLEEWERRGRPPLILAGDFNNPPMGPVYDCVSAKLIDALAALGVTDGTIRLGAWVRIDHVFHSADWRAAAGKVLPADGSDHRPVVVTLQPTKS